MWGSKISVPILIVVSNKCQATTVCVNRGDFFVKEKDVAMEVSCEADLFSIGRPGGVKRSNRSRREASRELLIRCARDSVLSDRARCVPTAQVNPTMAASDCIRVVGKQKLSRNASAVSDAPDYRTQVGTARCAGRVRYSCLKEAARGEAFMQIQWCRRDEKGVG
jgi:hypothetical protein